MKEPLASGFVEGAFVYLFFKYGGQPPFLLGFFVFVGKVGIGVSQWMRAVPRSEAWFPATEGTLAFAFIEAAWAYFLFKYGPRKGVKKRLAPGQRPCSLEVEP